MGPATMPPASTQDEREKPQSQAIAKIITMSLFLTTLATLAQHRLERFRAGPSNAFELLRRR